jgi:hypothetical protein
MIFWVHIHIRTNYRVPTYRKSVHIHIQEKVSPFLTKKNKYEFRWRSRIMLLSLQFISLVAAWLVLACAGWKPFLVHAYLNQLHSFPHSDWFLQQLCPLCRIVAKRAFFVQNYAPSSENDPSNKRTRIERNRNK